MKKQPMPQGTECNSEVQQLCHPKDNYEQHSNGSQTPFPVDTGENEGRTEAYANSAPAATFRFQAYEKDFSSCSIE